MDILFNFFYLLVTAVFVASVWWGTLRLMDKSGGWSFSAKLKIISADPMALALYFGARLIALALLFAPLLRVIL